MRLLYLITSLEQGGAEQVLYDTVTGLDPHKFEATVICMSRRGPYFEKLRGLGYCVESLDVTGKFAPGAFLRLLARVQQIRPDIIHAHLFHADLPGRLAKVLAWLPKRPVYLSHQHIPEQRSLPLRGVAERMSGALVDRYLCVSEAVRAHLEEAGFAKERLQVFPNGRALGEFLKIPEPSAERKQSWQLGSVGRLDPQKDQALMIEALALLVGEGLDVELSIAGDGPLLEELLERAGQLGVADRLHLRGRLEDIPSFLGGLDLFVMSSRYEGLPIAVIEAMAAARPVVATDVPGMRDVLGEAGVLVPYREPEALAEAIAERLRDPEERCEMARQGRRRARQEFSLETMIQRLEELYREMVVL